MRDTTPPVITIQTNVVLECPATDTSTNVTGVPVVQDTCGTVKFYYSDVVSNGCAATKIISRTWTATDEAGNSTNVVQTIIVADTTPPVFNCPGNKTVECTAPWNFDAPTATDACGTNPIGIDN